MIGQATAHRRANAFAQVLEAAERRKSAADPATDSAAEPATQHAARHTDPQQERLRVLAGALADVPRPTLDPDVRIIQRAQLIAAMEAALADGSLAATEVSRAAGRARVPEQRTSSGGGAHRAAGLRRLRPRSRWSRRLAAGGLTVGVAAGAFSGVAAASTDALPGDTLYGLKRGMEDLRLDMTASDAARGQVFLDMASTRLQEARRLMERTRSGPLDAESVREVGSALSGMHTEASEGHRLLSSAYRRNGSLAPIQALNAFAQAHRTTWSRLRGELPAQLTGVGEQVTSVFNAIEHEVAPLQNLLPPTAGAGGSAGVRGSQAPHGDSPRRSSSASPRSGADQYGQSAPQDPTGSAGPGVTGSPGQGLLGGSGLLNSPSGTDGLAGTQSPSPDASPSGTTQSDVPLPPLLPGLLPDLGLGSGDGSGT